MDLSVKHAHESNNAYSFYVAMFFFLVQTPEGLAQSLNGPELIICCLRNAVKISPAYLKGGGGRFCEDRF